MTVSRLVVNADDLGVTPGATRGIVEAHRRGCVTSASLVVTTPHYRHALDTCVRTCPVLGIGLHFALTLGTPASPSERVPLLIDKTGRFRWRFTSLLRAMTGVRPAHLAEQIGIELEAQLARLRADGIRPDHIDGERHVHLIPGIFELVTAAAARHKVPFVRAGVDADVGFPRLQHLPTLLMSGAFVKSWLLSRLALRARASLPSGVRSADCVASYRYSGRMDLVLDSVLSRPADSRIIEIMVHPGFPDESRAVDAGDPQMNRYLASEGRRRELDACVAAGSLSQRQQVTTFAKLAAAERVMVVRMGREHVDAVARLHCSSLGGLLSRLGAPAVRAYYRGALRTGQLEAFVYLADGVVAGFVSGSAQPRELKRGVLQANPFGMLAGTVTGALLRPSSLRWLAQGFLGRHSDAFDVHAAELTYLATTGQQRGRGIGRRLVDAFSAAMRERGVAAYELSVEEDNRAAAGFYEHLGFRRLGTYGEFDTTYRRYRIETGAPTAGRDART